MEKAELLESNYSVARLSVVQFGRGSMLIKVVYRNNECGMAKPFLFDELISSGRIIKFFRSDGWVTIGVDPIRVNDYRYNGPERRTNSFRELLKWCREEFFEKG
jgi:hypothetical protein